MLLCLHYVARLHDNGNLNDFIVNWKKVEALLFARGSSSGEKQFKVSEVCMHIIGRMFSENWRFNNASGEHSACD